MARFGDELAKLSSSAVELFLELAAKARQAFVAPESFLFLFLFDARARGGGGAAIAREPLLLRVELSALAFEPLHELSDLTLALALKLARAGDDIGRKAEALRHLESKASARGALHDRVGRRIGLRVELKRRCVDTFGRARIGFQEAVMGGRDHECSAREEVLHERGPESASLRWIGARPHFVEDNERRKLELGLHSDHFRQVRRECGQIGRNGLIVADIREQSSKDGKRALGARRNVEACLHHQAEKASRLERDRLAARVGAGKDEAAALAGHVEAYRDSLVHKRVTGIDESEAFPDSRLRGAIGGGESAFCLGEVELRHDFECLREHWAARPDALCERREDPAHFLPLTI